jgi:hypothetical protein
VTGFAITTQGETIGFQQADIQDIGPGTTFEVETFADYLLPIFRGDADEAARDSAEEFREQLADRYGIRTRVVDAYGVNVDPTGQERHFVLEVVEVTDPTGVTLAGATGILFAVSAILAGLAALVVSVQIVRADVSLNDLTDDLKEIGRDAFLAVAIVSAVWLVLSIR